jgi:hypothetical protein
MKQFEKKKLKDEFLDRDLKAKRKHVKCTLIEYMIVLMEYNIA